VGADDTQVRPQGKDQCYLMAVSRIKVSGPLFDGVANQAVRDWLDKTKKQVADQGVRELDAVTMDKTGRGTGHYQEALRTRTTGSYGDILIDDPIVYGPWLEGVSRRNESTRFKGYHLWRRTRTRVRATYKDYADAYLKEYLHRMGGV
jgi:hypothetical protein